MNRLPADGQRRTMREFEVTVLPTRSGATVVVVAASDRDAALSTVAEELTSGDFTAPPEHCTDDVQPEIWTIRELHKGRKVGYLDLEPFAQSSASRSASTDVIANVPGPIDMFSNVRHRAAAAAPPIFTTVGRAG